MAGLVLLSLIIATIFIVLVPANIFIWRKWFIAERDLQMGLMVLGLALMVLAYEVYRFIRRSESPWRSIALIVVFVIPVNVLVWVVMLIAEREPSIGFTALGILIILFVFKAYKVYCFVKSAEKPWQILREDLKKSLKILFAFALTIYAYMVLLVALFPTEYGRCDFYNEKLNGGY